MIQKSGIFTAKIVRRAGDGFVVRWHDSTENEDPRSIASLLGEENREGSFFFAPKKSLDNYEIGQKIQLRAKIVSFLEECRNV